MSKKGGGRVDKKKRQTWAENCWINVALFKKKNCEHEVEH